jgi:hypothetical protein
MRIGSDGSGSPLLFLPSQDLNCAVSGEWGYFVLEVYRYHRYLGHLSSLMTATYEVAIVPLRPLPDRYQPA